MHAKEIAAIFEKIALLLEIRGDNPFKIRAYQNAARALDNLDEDLSTLIRDDQLQSVRGIGPALHDKILELYNTGELSFYDELQESIAPGLMNMLEIPGLGPKKVRAIHQSLGIDTIVGLQNACRENQIAQLPGFGEKSQQKILDGIQNREIYSKRHLWIDAFSIAQPILEGLRSLPEVECAEHAGSLRRYLETVGDLDFVVASSRPKPIMQWFTSQPNILEVTAHGETKSSIRLENGIQADLRIIPMDTFFFALHHFTGSKEHNVKMRQLALSKGYSLSEWGIRPESGSPDLSVSKIESERALFKILGLHFIDPALREDRGEIEAAAKGRLPELITFSDIRGVFHNHTKASDGNNSIEEMAKASEKLGWEYLGIADHSKSSFQANGLNEERLWAQIKAIRAFNASHKSSVHVFTGIECDILANGALDLDDSVLRELDYIVLSIHNALSQDEATITKRMIRAIENPYPIMIGHVTSRLLLRREPTSINVSKVIDAAIANRKIIELNANPRRLDMDWRYWHKASERGLLCSINPDAHDVDSLELVKLGVHIARKGWLTLESVFNTWPLTRVQEYLKSMGSLH